MDMQPPTSSKTFAAQGTGSPGNRSLVDTQSFPSIPISGDSKMKNAVHNQSQRGFTLVEVIVVAIIVAALAAVAIPLYNGYVTSSRNNAAANASGSVASFMGACISQGGNATGIVENTPTAVPAAGLTLTCAGTPSTTPITITVPTGITLTVTDLNSSPGQARAQPPGGDVQTYSY
jgi:prepilin-type N-terminal cleavage/methylation domain-containing protein